MQKLLTTSAAALCMTLSAPAVYADANGINKFISKSVVEGAIEIEAGFSEDYDGTKSSDVAVATVELVIDSTINKKITTHILLLHEEDDTSLEVDEATISFKMNESFKLTAGQLYLPFGNYETNMISDSMPHEFSEAREIAVQLEFENGNLTTTFYAFNGDVVKTGDDESIDSVGVNLTYFSDKTKLGISYINNMSDSDLITDSLVDSTAVTSTVAGLSVFATQSFGNTSIYFELVSALDEFTASDLTASTSNDKPSTVNLEAGFELTDKSMFSIAYQASNEAAAFDLPETRYLASYSMELMKDTSLAFELAADTNYLREKATTITAQLAVAF